MKPKLKSFIGVNWITVHWVSKYTDTCLPIWFLNTGFKIPNKECYGNYVLISKEWHWRSPTKKLEEEPEKKITGLAGKTRGQEKLRLILISQVYSWKEWYLVSSKKVFLFEFWLIISTVLKCSFWHNLCKHSLPIWRKVILIYSFLFQSKIFLMYMM